jgi:CheY-like chemotaxis protein
LARKILLADDSVTAQNMGRRILSDAGYEVITVNNGSAALKKIAELVPDLIVLDVYMPGYGGLEVCQRLKESQATARIPVLLTVGKLEPFKVEEARRVRADAHIVKPFDSNELLAAIIKLEDKIVPLPAAPKQGRSAKAASSVEAPSPRRSRDKSSDPSSETSSGWKKRLSIPRSTPAPDDIEEKQPKPASAGAFHDLSRDEDQKPAEAKLPEAAPEIAHTQEIPPSEEKPSPARSFENFNVERLMAIEASTPADEAPSLRQEVETKSEPTASEAPVAEVAPPAALALEPALAAEVHSSEEVAIEPTTAPKTETSEQSPSEAEVMAALASLSPANGDASKSPADKANDVHAESDKEIADNAPATAMAGALAAVGAVCGGPRWMAEPVPLSDGDSHLLLESEMEKTYAAVAADESARTAAIATEMDSDAGAIESPVTVSEQDSSIQVQSPAESQLDSDSSVRELISTPEMGAPPASENVAAALAAELPSSATVEHAPEPAPESAANETVNAISETEPIEVKADSSATAAAEEMSSIGYREIAFAAAASAGPQPIETRRGDFRSFAVESPVSAESPVPEGPNAISNDIFVPPAESSDEVQASAAAVSPIADASESNTENQERESQLAAAWQNWRQIRETIVGPQLTSQITDAAAAGFKQIRGDETLPTDQQEIEAGESDRVAAEASTIAGIVDSVFAELKPKLMEEIAKKLAGDRK